MGPGLGATGLAAGITSPPTTLIAIGWAAPPAWPTARNGSTTPKTSTAEGGGGRRLQSPAAEALAEAGPSPGVCDLAKLHEKRPPIQTAF